MLLYLLKSGACLVIFYGFYKLLLEKESIHTFKRYYLLASVSLAFIIPFITFTEYTEIAPQEVPLLYSDVPLTNLIIEDEPFNYIPFILWSMYGLGVFLFSIKFFKNLLQLLYKIKYNTKVKIDQFTHVLLQDLIVPHTFFDYIFLNKQKFETQQIPKEVLLHEETHAKQKHSLDVLFIEIVHILFWFNPLIYFIKKDIKLNHEFLADQAVLKQGIASSTYQKTLLAFSSPDSYRDAHSPLANAIHYSSIKKRFTVMKTHTSKKAIWLRSIIILPLLAMLIYSFSDKKVIEKPYTLQVINNENGVSEALMKEYREFIINAEATKAINFPKHQRAVAIYDLMTEKQRNSVKKYPENIVPDITKVEPKTPTETEFNSWKYSNKFAIWIDGKPVKNSTLDNYKVSDIKYFTSSFVYNNARSDKFPQPYQNHLYTKKGFEETYLKRNVEKYNGLKAQYLKANKENNLNSDELRILKAQLDRVFENLTKEEIEKYNITKVPTIITNTNDFQQKASSVEIEEYNTLIKQFNSNSEGRRILKVKDKNRIEQIYDLMNAEQKRDNEAFPNFLTVAPPPQPYQQKATPEEIKEYNALVKKFNNYKEKKQIYSLAELKRSSVLFEKMNKEQKVTIDAMPVMPPSPMPPIPTLPKNPSKDLLEAKKNFDDRSTAYYELVGVYFSGKEIDSKKLWSLYDESIKLYYEFVELNKKEVEGVKD